jgi:hypothetical protein
LLRVLLADLRIERRQLAQERAQLSALRICWPAKDPDHAHRSGEELLP